MQIGKYEPLEIPNINGYLTTALSVFNQFDSFTLIILALGLIKDTVGARKYFTSELVRTCNVSRSGAEANSISNVAFRIVAGLELFHCVLILLYFIFRMLGIEAPQNDKISPKYHGLLALSVLVGIVGSVFILADDKFCMKAGLGAIGLILLGVCRLLRCSSFCANPTILEVYPDMTDLEVEERVPLTTMAGANTITTSASSEILEVETVESIGSVSESTIQNQSTSTPAAVPSVDTGVSPSIQSTAKQAPEPIVSIKLCGVDVCQASMINTAKLRFPIPKSRNLLKNIRGFHFIRLFYIFVLLGVLGLQYSNYISSHGSNNCLYMQKNMKGLALVVHTVLFIVLMEVLYLFHVCYVIIAILIYSPNHNSRDRNRAVIISCICTSGVCSFIGVMMILFDLRLRTVGIAGLIFIAMSQFLCSYVFTMNNVTVNWGKFFENMGILKVCPILPVVHSSDNSNDNGNEIQVISLTTASTSTGHGNSRNV